MTARRRAAIAGLAVAGAAASLALAGPAVATSRSPQAAVRAAERQAGVLEAQVALLREATERHADRQACLRTVPVSEYGSPDATSGYRYDARDGTGVGYAPALAVDTRSRPGQEDYLLFDLRRDGGCDSAAPVAGGTADAARRRLTGPRTGPAPRTQPAPSMRPAPRTGPAAPTTAAAPARAPSLRVRVDRLERRVRRLRAAVHALEVAAKGFDVWESCVSWIPVTENGDPGRGFGYLYGRAGGPPSYRPALTIDRSDWDDPDYMLLALVGGDRPGKSCRDEPGEAVD